ncbi:MAG: glycosyltransferase N-terminal domain-containing protein, partial [Xanthomonadales bacterium]|nr:glycosyltransferase N-terminal domain-containing protein [Xanthomonadales bacterium]
MRHVYSLLVYLLTPLLLGYILVRGLSDRRWWSRLSERFGDFDATGRMHGIVVHAASVGEVNAAAPLIRAMLSRWPNLPVTVTCFTPTGSERIRSLFGDAVYHVYVPFDLPGSVRRFFATLRPRLVVVMETELWPNLFHRAEALDIPLLISNARLTARSARSWGRFPGLAAATLRCATLIAAQDSNEAQRFVAIGADRDRTRVCGNLKFEIALPPDLARQGQAWRARWGAQRIVMVAGSTHEADERALLAAFARVRERNPEAMLVIAPRY